MKKVKNVIKGYLSQEDITRLVIIDPNSDDIAIFSGDINDYLNPIDIMRGYKNNVDNMDVVKSAVNCGSQLFLIVRKEA